MGFEVRLRSFRVRVLARVLVLSGTLLLFIFLLSTKSYYVTATLVGAAVVFQIYRLFRFVETSNSRLVEFLRAVESSDFSQGFSTGIRGKTFEELDVAFSEVIRRFRQTRLEREESARFLQAVVRHVSSGLIAFQDDGKVELINPAGKRLLGVSGLRHIEELGEISPRLLARLQEPGTKESSLIKLTRHHAVVQLAVRLTELRLLGRKITLVAFQNISDELNEQEMAAWQNLVRVFTHEIRNSLTPVTSLAATVEELVDSGDASPGVTGDVREALRTIRGRSQGLLDFVNAYRELTRVPKPELEVFALAGLLERVETLVARQLEDHQVRLTVAVDPADLCLKADPRLIEQVVFNLVLNALQALEDRTDPRIELAAGTDAGATTITVTDNGPGIVAGARDKIFVPFFSTKPGGTGIGLALSRQIMRLHRGELTVRSEPDRETRFTLRF